eukprot:Skav227050  [mRNA]  locus=scaffold72:707722:710913:- [translate_table: standard]
MAVVAQNGVRCGGDVVMADMHPINMLVVGECGDGKSTLIDNLRDKTKSAQPATGKNAKGVTKEIMMYPCPDVGGAPVNLIDTPGVGDWDCTVIQLVSMIEAFLTEGMVPGGIRGVVVTLPVNDARIKLGAQIVQAVVDKGFVAPHGDDKYANIILCGTKVGLFEFVCLDLSNLLMGESWAISFSGKSGNSAPGIPCEVDKADPEDITNFMEGLDGAPSVRSLFFDNSPNKTGPTALVHKARILVSQTLIMNLKCSFHSLYVVVPFVLSLLRRQITLSCLMQLQTCPTAPLPSRSQRAR